MRNKFTCAARGCEGCSVCEEYADARRAERLEELLNNIINIHSKYFDRNQRDWPESLYNAVKEADDYLNG